MAAKPKNARKGRAWNAGLKLGQRDALTPAEVKRIRRLLIERGVAGQRDLALFCVAIDTMIQAPDLLALTVKDVRQRDGTMRVVLEVNRSRGKKPLRCAMSKSATDALEAWITASGKKPGDYLFHGRNPGSRPMTPRNLGRLLKGWVGGAGLDETRFGIESLRRTKALHILNGTGDLETVRVLLGHNKIESTANFLRIVRKTDPIAVARAFDI